MALLRPPRPASSGTSSSSPVCRRASGRTSASAALSSAPRTSSTPSPAATPPRGPRGPRSTDETRLFHVAVTRARQRLVVTAVRSEDEQPSPYLDVVDPRPDARPFTDVPRPMTLPGLVGELRRTLLDADPGVRGAAVTTLARLARAGVTGATPGSGGRCAAPPTTDPVAPPTFPSASRPRWSTGSGSAASSGCCGRAVGTVPRWVPRTSARSSTRSPISATPTPPRTPPSRTAAGAGSGCRRAGSLPGATSPGPRR